MSVAVRAVNLVRVALAVLLRPALWPATAALLVRLVPWPWGRRGPVPDRAYLVYRGQAVYGRPLSLVEPEDVVRYLEWCRAFPGPIR